MKIDFNDVYFFHHVVHFCTHRSSQTDDDESAPQSVLSISVLLTRLIRERERDGKVQMEWDWELEV